MRILSVSRRYQGTITESGNKHTRSKIVRFTQGLLKFEKASWSAHCKMCSSLLSPRPLCEGLQVQNSF